MLQCKVLPRDLGAAAAEPHHISFVGFFDLVTLAKRSHTLYRAPLIGGGHNQ